MQYVFLTIILTIYGQLIIKWQVMSIDAAPELAYDKIIYLIKLVFNPWVLSGLLAAFIAGLSWILAMSKLQLSYAYPFISLTFVFVLMFSSLLFYEPITWQKVLGLAFIILGVCISANG